MSSLIKNKPATGRISSLHRKPKKPGRKVKNRPGKWDKALGTAWSKEDIDRFVRRFTWLGCSHAVRIFDLKLRQERWTTPLIPGRDGGAARPKPLDRTTIKRFLAGEEPRLACPPRKYVIVIAIDIDNHEDDPRVVEKFDFICGRLRALKIPFTYEVSPRGWHLFIRLTSAVKGETLRTWTLRFLRHRGLWIEGHTEVFIGVDQRLALPFGHGRTFVDGQTDQSITVNSPADARKAFEIFENASRIQPRRLKGLSRKKRPRGRPRKNIKTKSESCGSNDRGSLRPESPSKEKKQKIQAHQKATRGVSRSNTLRAKDIAVVPRPDLPAQEWEKLRENIIAQFPSGLQPGMRNQATFDAVRGLIFSGFQAEASYWCALEWLIDQRDGSRDMTLMPEKVARDLWDTIQRYEKFREKHAKPRWPPSRPSHADVQDLRGRCNRSMAHNIAAVLAVFRSLHNVGDEVPLTTRFLTGVTGGAKNSRTRARIRSLMIRFGYIEQARRPDRTQRKATLYRILNLGVTDAFRSGTPVQKVETIDAAIGAAS